MALYSIVNQIYLIMNKTKVTYVVSNINKALAFEWIEQNLNPSHFYLQFILINQRPSELTHYLKKRGVKVDELIYNNKFSLWIAFLKCFKILFLCKPNVIHTHLFEANLIGLTCAWALCVKKRIYTRHHALTHYTEHPNGLKWDKWCNFISTDIIAVSKNVKTILIKRDKTPPSKVKLIQHGFDLKIFENIDNKRISLLKQKYLLQEENHPVIGIISRYIHSKGIQFVIPAFKKILATHADAILILANAHGPYEGDIKKLLSGIPSSNYREIIFENDLPALYKLFDIHVHVPSYLEYEAFGQTYVEALAAGIPSVFTLSGVAPEFIVHNKNAKVIDYQNEHDIHSAIISILNNKKQSEIIIKNGKYDVVELFSLKRFIGKLEHLYLN